MVDLDQKPYPLIASMALRPQYLVFKDPFVDVSFYLHGYDRVVVIIGVLPPLQRETFDVVEPAQIDADQAVV